MKKKIGIDARFYGEAGPGRYVSQLLKNLEEIDHENEYIVYLKKSNFNAFDSRAKNFEKKLADYRWYSFSEQTLFLLELYKQNFDLVHFTQINAPLLYFKTFVVTIHDTILHEFSTERGGLLGRILYRLKKIPYYLVFAKNVYFSKEIIVPSRASKNDLLKYYSFVNPQKITVTYEAVEHYPSSLEVKNRTEILEKYGISKPYLLCLGSFYPHKNITRLVQSFELIKAKGDFSGQLVLLGKESFFSKKIQHLVKEKNLADVIFPSVIKSKDYLTDDEVEVILANAFAFVQPALKEGFGLPPLEAMVFSVPTAVSNIECLKEMCGQASIYFDPTNINDMADKITQLLKDNVLRDELIKKGLENVKRFSWAKMASETLEVYNSLKI